REEHRDPERVHRREELLRALSSGPGSEAVPAAPTAGTASAPWVRRPGRPGPSTRYAVVTGPADTARRARTGPAAATVTAQRRAARAAGRHRRRVLRGRLCRPAEPARQSADSCGPGCRGHVPAVPGHSEPRPRRRLLPDGVLRGDRVRGRPRHALGTPRGSVVRGGRPRRLLRPDRTRRATGVDPLVADRLRRDLRPDRAWRQPEGTPPLCGGRAQRRGRHRTDETPAEAAGAAAAHRTGARDQRGSPVALALPADRRTVTGGAADPRLATGHGETGPGGRASRT